MAVSVYRRPRSPYYWYNIPPSLSPTGKRVRASTKRDKKRAAELVAETELQRLLDRKQSGGRPTLTLREALFEHYLPSRSRKASYVDLKRYARKLVGEYEGVKGVALAHTPFHDITGTMLRKYRERRADQGASDQTIDHEIKVVSGAYHMLEADFQVRPGLKFPMARPKGKPRPITVEEEAKLLAELDPRRPIQTGKSDRTYLLDALAEEYAERQDNHDIVVLLLDTGCRFGEIAKLTWDRVDTMEWRWLHIYRSKVDNEGRLALTDRMREVLKRRRVDHNGHYVFPGKEKGTHKRSTAAIRRAIDRVGINAPHNVERYGRRDVRSLRDTFATKLRLKGMSLDRLQKLLGHASPEMTAKYGDLPVDVASQEAVAILNQM